MTLRRKGLGHRGLFGLCFPRRTHSGLNEDIFADLTAWLLA